MKALPLLGALIAPALSFAQETTPVAALDPIVVTGTRTPVPMSQALSATTVITREDIERAQVNDIAELLRFQAGIELGRTGGPGQQTSLFIRGGESNHTLVLIDGVRVNPATAGGAALQNISPEMIDRIEIVRGPLSTLYGSDAIGGVINIITRMPDHPTGDLALRGGSLDTKDAAASLGYGDADKSFVAQVQNLTTNGIPPCEGDDVDREYDQTTINVRGTTKIGSKTRVSARAWNASGQTQFTSFCGPFGGPGEENFRNQVVAVDAAVDVTQNWSSTLSVARTEDNIRQRHSADFVKTIHPAVDWHNVLTLSPANRLSFGLSGARDDVTSLSFGDAIDEDRDIGSIFVQDEITLGALRSVLAVNGTHYEGFGDEVTWNAEVGYDVLTDLRLLASAGSGFRAPDASDRFGFGGNPDLDPEEAKNYEVGVRWVPVADQVIDLRAFRSDVKDLISVVFDPSNDPTVDFGFRAVNIDKYRNNGAELTWRYDTKTWTADLSGIVQKPKDRSNDEILLRRAKRSVTAHLVRRFGRHEVGIAVLGTSKRRDIDAVSGADRFDGGYALVDLTCGVQLDEHFRLEGRLENLLDKTYQTAAGYNQPDFGGYVRLRYTW